MHLNVHQILFLFYFSEKKILCLFLFLSLVFFGKQGISMSACDIHSYPPPPKHTHRQRTRCRWNYYGASTVTNSWKMYAIPPPHTHRLIFYPLQPCLTVHHLNPKPQTPLYI